MASRKPIVLISGLFEELNTPTDKLDFAGNTTTDLTEGTNLYYTDARARASISVTDSGGDGSLSYDNSTGVITYTGPSASEVRAHFSVAAGSGLTYDSGTGEFGTNAIPNAQLANSSVTLGSTVVNLGDTKTTLSGFTLIESAQFNVNGLGIQFEGVTPDGFETTLVVEDPTADQVITLPDATGTVALLESLSATNTGSGYGSLSYNNTTGVFDFSVVTDADIRGSISVTDAGGDGSLSYNAGTGVITYTGPSASEVRTHFSVASGSGLTYNSGTGEFGTNNIPNSQLQNSTITLGSSSVALGSTLTTIAGLTSVTSAAIITNDNGFRVRNNSDTTKQLAFDVSGVTTSTTRTLAIPDENGTLALLEADNAFTGSNTFTDTTGQTFRQAATQDGIIIQGRNGGSSSYSVTFITDTLSSNQTATFPDLTGNVLLDTSTIPGDTFTDDTFRISDDSDNTKKLAFECSGITASTTRTMTVPDSNGTISTEDFATAVAIALG